MSIRRIAAQMQPALWDRKHEIAMKALATGTASGEQQMLALKWIIEAAARTYNSSFSPQNHSLTDFAEGRRFVGNQIVKLINLKSEN